MKTIERWLDEYADSHQSKTNKILHWICVPLIVFSLLGLFWSIGVPALFTKLPFTVNWAILIIALTMIYYYYISPSLATGMLIITVSLLPVLNWLNNQFDSLWLLSLAIFIIAWIGQFIGHEVEGRRPSFLKDVQFLLIGPLWLLSYIYRKFGIPY